MNVTQAPIYAKYELIRELNMMALHSFYASDFL